MLERAPRYLINIAVIGMLIILFLDLMLGSVGVSVQIKDGEKLTAVLLWLTLIGVLWYSEETQKLRKESVKQTDLNLAPYLTAGWDPKNLTLRSPLYVKNMGKGIAADIRFKRQPEFAENPYWRTRFEFKNITNISPESRDGVSVIYRDHSEPTGKVNEQRGVPIEVIPIDYMDPTKSDFMLIIQYRDIAGRLYKTTLHSDSFSNQGFMVAGYDSPSFKYRIMK